jgi:hypothetical protein
MRRRSASAAILNHDELGGLAPALRILLAADAGAAFAGRGRWQFAVELHFLLAGGVTPTDLRLLLSAGLVEHAVERPASNGRRAICRISNLSIPPQACFLLTKRGARLAASCLAAGPRVPAKNDLPDLRWDAALRELRFGGQLVCRFRWAAPNQELILTSFEELGWPRRIDDPLPPTHGGDRAARLRDALRALNRNVVASGIRFIADGAGWGVVWQRAGPARQ